MTVCKPTFGLQIIILLSALKSLKASHTFHSENDFVFSEKSKDLNELTIMSFDSRIVIEHNVMYFMSKDSNN